jgi:hemerythrin
MIIKLNAEELATKRSNEYVDDFFFGDDAAEKRHAYVIHKEAYFAAIEEVAQPIAEQRDELRDALQMLLVAWISERVLMQDDNPPEYVVIDTVDLVQKAWDVTNELLRKYPKP